MPRTVFTPIALALAATALTATPILAQTRSISASDRQLGAQAHPQLLQQYGGPYAGPQARYVEQIGKRVAVRSGLSNAQNDFVVTLLDSPVENAFAVPGGYVYVTRQLLALMNSEDELASVLGHEVGHVAARHSQRRNTRSTIGGLLAAGAGLLTGSDTIGRIAGIGAQLDTLGFSRSQEYEADTLGIRYASGAGYSASGMADMLEQLNAGQTLAGRVAGRGQNAVPSWMSTHPNGVERVRRARGLAQSAGGPPSRTGQDVAFLRSLDGLRYDDNPDQGVVTGNSFVHPQLGVRFTVPQGLTIANGAQAVTISGTGGQGEFRSAPTTSDLTGFLRQRLVALGANASMITPQTTTINGIPVAATTVRATANRQQVDMSIVAFRFPAGTHYFQLVTPAGRGTAPFQSMLSSVAQVSRSEAQAVRGKRVRIHTVRAGETVDSLSRQMAYTDFQRERFTTLNGIGAQDRLVPGMLVKLIVNG